MTYLNLSLPDISKWDPKDSGKDLDFLSPINSSLYSFCFLLLRTFHTGGLSKCYKESVMGKQIFLGSGPSWSLPASCIPRQLWMQPNPKLYIYLKHYEIFLLLRVIRYLMCGLRQLFFFFQCGPEMPICCTILRESPAPKHASCWYVFLQLCNKDLLNSHYKSGTVLHISGW